MAIAGDPDLAYVLIANDDSRERKQLANDARKQMDSDSSIFSWPSKLSAGESIVRVLPTRIE
jgi:hypothetical protein